MTIAALVVTDENNAIGKSYNFLQHLPAYLDFFHELTGDSPVIMGRKTFEEMGKVLKGKKNIVITRSSGYTAKGAKVFGSVRSALKSLSDEKAFIIGGGELFSQVMDDVSEIHRILIKIRFKSDQFYPEINTEDFELVSSECINTEDLFFYCVEKWERM